jgi:hypothetical protein
MCNISVPTYRELHFRLQVLAPTSLCVYLYLRDDILMPKRDSDLQKFEPVLTTDAIGSGLVVSTVGITERI